MELISRLLDDTDSVERFLEYGDSFDTWIVRDPETNSPLFNTTLQDIERHGSRGMIMYVVITIIGLQ